AEDRVGVEQRRGLHWRLEAGRLAAEMAVLRTAPCLGRQDALDLDLGPTPGQAHLVGQRREGGDRLPGDRGDGGELGGGEQAALVEQSLRGDGEQVSGHAVEPTSRAPRAEGARTT